MENVNSIVFEAKIIDGPLKTTYKIEEKQLIHEYTIEQITGEKNPYTNEPIINVVKICRGSMKYNELKEELKQVPSPINIDVENDSSYCKINLYDEKIEFINHDLKDNVVRQLFKIINKYFNFYLFFDDDMLKLDIDQSKIEKMPMVGNEEDKEFYAYEGGYFGSTYIFNIVKQRDKLRFEKDTYENKTIDDVDYQKIERKIRLFPTEMLALLEKNLLKATDKWQDNYEDKNVLDGTSWTIYLKDKLKFTGKNLYPKNYKETFELINKYFN